MTRHRVGCVAAPRRWILVAGLALLAWILCAADRSFAAEAAETSPVEAPIGTLFKWLNFVVVFGGAGYWIARTAPAYFRGRAQAIATSIAHAAAAKAEAERHLRQEEEKLAGLEQEVAALRGEAQRESAIEAERIRAVAREEVEKIHHAARAEIKAAERAARNELKALAARLAVERAEALIRRQVTAHTQARLFRLFLDDLARSAS